MKQVSAIVVAAGMLASVALQVRGELVDGIRAIVHDSIITHWEVVQYTLPLVDRLRSQYRTQPELFQQKLLEAQEENLEQLLERQLILREFEAAGFTNALPDSAVDEELQSYVRANYGDDRVRFVKTLQAEGKTLESFRTEFRNRIIVQQMRYSREAGAGIVSPHKIEVYYTNHQDQFKQESEIRLRMIVLNKSNDDPDQARKLADEVLAKINEGAAFSEMATIYSQGTQRNEGGDWGWVARSVLRKELSDAAFALDPGKHSDVIDTPEACYLMYVEDQRPERVLPLSEVRDRIEAILSAQERNRLQQQWIERLKKKTFVRYF